MWHGLRRESHSILANVEMKPDFFWTDSTVTDDKAILNIQLLLGQPWYVTVAVTSHMELTGVGETGSGVLWSLMASISVWKIPVLPVPQMLICVKQTKQIFYITSVIMIRGVYLT